MKNNFRYFKLLLAVLVIAACARKEENEHNSTHHHSHSAAREIYTCPMPEDSVFSDKPGNCPKCGMELVKAGSNKKFFSCPMHEEVISDKSGKCPKCHMDLEPIAAIPAVDTLETLIKPTNHMVISRLKPVVPSLNKGARRIRAEGYLTYDPDKASSISARVSGRIQKLFVRYNFQTVNKGDRLLEIYSPELLTAQNEWLYLQKKILPADKTTADAARAKLINLGMTEKALTEIEQTGKTYPYVPVFADASGHVHFLNGITDISSHAFGLSGTGRDGMTGGGSDNEDAQVLREGDYVKSGDVLFTIADQSSLWALFKVLPADIGGLKTGQEVEVSVNGETHDGTVNFIEKTFRDFYTVRVSLFCDDHSKLKIGTLVKGYISTGRSDKKSLWVPRDAVLSLGKSKSVVFVKSELGYKAKAIFTGARSEEWTEVSGGLSPADSIAPVASFLVDNEAFIETEE